MTRAGDSTLGVHHHASFYKDEKGNYFIASFIALWLEALSSGWKEVVYLGYETDCRLRGQDSIVRNPKIRFVSMGKPGGLLSLPKRISAMKKAVKAHMEVVDALIVRAPTPRQGTIFKIFKGKKKALYIVGSPPANSVFESARTGGAMGILMEVLNRRRKKQTKRLAGEAVVIANSLELCGKYGNMLRKEVFYAPSSSIGSQDFFHVEDRCVSSYIRLLFVGRVCRAKGVNELIKAASLMKKKGIQFLLDIVGGGGDANKLETFMDISKKENTEDVISWHGQVPHGPTLFDLFRNADIMILPSEHEGFPHVIHEAMANGVLVLVTRVGGIPDLCAHEKELYFIEKTSESIVGAVERLISDPELRKKMIAGGYAFAKDHLVGENEKKLTAILEEQWS